jgi:hypothetical protein
MLWDRIFLREFSNRSGEHPGQLPGVSAYAQDGPVASESDSVRRIRGRFKPHGVERVRAVKPVRRSVSKEQVRRSAIRDQLHELEKAIGIAVEEHLGGDTGVDTPGGHAVMMTNVESRAAM